MGQKASYYDNSSIDPRWGGATKSGEQFDETKLTAAVLPSQWKAMKGKSVKVTNTANSKSVIVKINDTGGFEKYGRSIDLSKKAFSMIGDTKSGVIDVKIEPLQTLGKTDGVANARK